MTKFTKTALIALLLLILIVLDLKYNPNKQKVIPIANTELGYNQNLTVGQTKIKVKVAQTPTEHQQGLSDQRELCQTCGMLFDFEQADIYPFWMKRMYFDIDILWLKDNQIVDITFAAKKPSAEDFEAPKEIYKSKVPVDQVLEVNAGWVEKNGIKIGDTIGNN